MAWIELTIYTNKENLEPISSILDEVGLTSICIEDPDDMLEFVTENSQNWDLVDEGLLCSLKQIRPNIKAYIPQDKQNEGMLKILESRLNEFSLGKNDNTEYIVSILENEDWANNWKKFFKPMELGEKLAIVPSWEDYKENGRIIVSVDPGSSFGSGMHETTQMCLTSLEEYIIEGDTVIDVGSGSGILSAAAAKLGAGKVIAIDIDPNSIKDTENTLKANGVMDKCETLCADITENYSGKADIIVGNLFANIIVRLTESAWNILCTDGLLITSGIISEALDEVLDAYQKNGFDIIETINQNDWYCVVGQKQA